jgi:dTDP-4-amino-4,6-dideoxygalactose transaminase
METAWTVPYHVPSIGQEEIDEVTDTLRSGWLTTGPKVRQFEEEFRTFVGAPNALALNSCTAALHLALVAMNLEPGDEVITTPLTFCATINSVIHAGGVPVLADVDCDGNLDPRSVADAITPRTRVVLPVHFAGLPCDMQSIWALARRRGLNVIEDAAHALPASFRGVRIGGQSPWGASDAVAFSFYATKCLTTGEGGMLTTRDAPVHARCKSLSLHGISADAWMRYADTRRWFYEVRECGFKCNMGDVQAAIGIHQLHKQIAFREQRAAIAARYTEAFSRFDGFIVPRSPADRSHAWHLYVLRLRGETLPDARDAFLDALHRDGVGASVHFIPIPLHPVYAGRFPSAAWTHARAFYESALSLPIYPGMTGRQVDLVISTVEKVLTATRRPLFAVAGS